MFDIVALSGDQKEAMFAQGAYRLIGTGILGALLAAQYGVRLASPDHQSEGFR